MKFYSHKFYKSRFITQKFIYHSCEMKLNKNFLVWRWVACQSPVLNGDTNWPKTYTKIMGWHQNYICTECLPVSTHRWIGRFPTAREDKIQATGWWDRPFLLRKRLVWWFALCQTPNSRDNLYWVCVCLILRDFDLSKYYNLSGI